MKRKLVTLSLMILVLVALTNESSTEAVVVDSCTTRCDGYRSNTCWYSAVAAYVTCGQETDLTEEQCRQVRRRKFVDCMAIVDCDQCMDWNGYPISQPRSYYCACGKPWAVNKGGGDIIPPYTYDPEDYSETGWYCETYPELCNPDLPW